MSGRADVARRALGLIDLTDLGETSSADAVEALCRRAAGPHGSTAAVCIWPRFVAHAAGALAGTGVTVATVVNFPRGDEDVDPVVRETDAALAAGADEIDLVLPYRAFLEGRVGAAEAMVDAVRAHVTDGRLLKVILETGSYPGQRQVADATRFAIDHGADFVKTSTGKTAQSATPEAVRTMLREVRDSGRRVGIKPSGGIRTVEDAATYLDLADDVMGARWTTRETFRFGASGLLDDVESELAGTGSASAPAALEY
jgi:deoxyribose-phosphate aldolase